LTLRNLLLLSLTSVIALAQQPRDTVVVTGTYEPMSLEEIDRAIRVLPVRSDALVVNNLTDLLKLDPSLDLQERAPDGVQVDLSIRGSSFGQTLILLNGMRLNDPQTGHANMDIPVPLEDVDRIEVMRGSGSTLYGSDAIGGVINIITAPPPVTEFRLRTALGNDGINQERFSGAIVGKKVSEEIAVSRDFSTGFEPDRDYRNLQLVSTTRLATDIGNGSLNLAYMDHPFGADQFYGNYPSWEDTKTWFAGVEQSLGEKTKVSFSFRRHSDLFVLFRYRPQIYTNHHEDESLNAAVRRREELSTATTLFYGVEALHESISSTNLGDHSRSRAAGYAAVDFRALKRFSLTLSAREELYRAYSAAFTPTIAGGYWINTQWKARASVSRAFRIPTYTELYYSDPANLGNPNLRPESAWSYESGVDWVPSAKLRGELTLFERREHNDIDYFRTSPAQLWQALNIDNLNFKGWEASLRWTPTAVHALDFRYTQLTGSEDTVPLGFTKYTFNYPAKSGVFGWRITPNANFLLRTRVGVLERRDQSPYALWDIYAGLPRHKVHPFVQVTNMANTGYQEIQGVAMPGRTILGGVEVVLSRK
jgi:iron complex outermembrane receptor protein